MRNFFGKKPLKNTSVVAVRMTVFKGNIQKMVARIYPCIYPCFYLCAYLCIHSRIYYCFLLVYTPVYLFTYLSIYLTVYLPIFFSANSHHVFLQIIHSSLLILSDIKSIDHSRVFTSPVLYILSYALFFGLGKVHMVGTCLVIA